MISQFIPPILKEAYQKIINNRKKKYQIGKYKISIPSNYALPNSQKIFKLYDRFLPVLANNLSSGKIIIDVGANIGDTTIAMLQNCTNPIICIEPSDLFIPYLESNLGLLTSEHIKRIKVIKKFVGTGTLKGELKHSEAGTASVKISNGSNTIFYNKLDELISKTNDVLLLKVDTDGFDFDVIKSSKKILSDSEPILFWENEIFEDFQKVGFDELYSLLTEIGYKYIYIFDNFGNIIIEESDFKTLKDLNSYLYTMRKNDCTRTFYYTDILAATEKNYDIVNAAINEYKKEYIYK